MAHDVDTATTLDTVTNARIALPAPEAGHALTVIDALRLAAPEGTTGTPFDYAALAVDDRLVIQQIAREIRADMQEVEHRGIRMGQRLLLVRERLSRRSGAWLPWLRAECPAIGRDTAENLMNKARLAADRPNYSAYESLFDSTALTKLAKPSTPQAALDEAERRVAQGERVTARDAEELIRAAKAAAGDGGATFAARTAQGEVRVPIRAQEGPLALHRAVEDAAGFCISHMPSGMVLPRVFVSEVAAATALHLLAALDWTAVAGDGDGATVPPALAAQVRRLLGLPPASVSAAWDALRQLDRDLAAGQGDATTRTALHRLELEAAALDEPHRTQVRDQIAAIRRSRVGALRGAAPAPPPPAWCQPLGAAGSGRWVPIVPHVMLIEPRLLAYAPARLLRMEVQYETDATVRVGSGSDERTVLQTSAYCLPSDAAWVELTTAHAVYELALGTLARHLRGLGRYHTRVAEAGGGAANPLTPWGIICPDPDDKPTPLGLPWRLPMLDRHIIVRHTAKMLYWRDRETYETPSAQHHFTVCPDEGAWATALAQRAACETAREALETLLTRLGTYQEARADGRHTGGVPVAQARAGAKGATGAVNAPQGATRAVNAPQGATGAVDAPQGATGAVEAPQGATGAEMLLQRAEMLLQRVETLLAQGRALPPACETDLVCCEALWDEARAEVQRRIDSARASLHAVAVQMGLVE